MDIYFHLLKEINRRKTSFAYRNIFERLHIDMPLLVGVLILMGFGLILLYSAANGKTYLIGKQLSHIGISIVTMFLVAQIPPIFLKRWTNNFFWIGFILLLGVLAMGKIGKGAQRWLDLGGFRFQPSELMKFAVPMMVSYKLSKLPTPPPLRHILLLSCYIVLPCFLIAKQPDLGTAVLIVTSTSTLFILAGMRWKQIIYFGLFIFFSAPLGWFLLHSYQKDRILTFINPERDPLGSGYHIIQSKIAIGSGGLLGKGWLQGSQSHLDFLPERTTDFIFAVCGEEFGLVGCLILLIIYLIITLRALYLSQLATDTFSRFLSCSLSLTFIFNAIVNIGMVTGILPVVGIPLPLVSYGGTSMLTMLMGFGMIMSINTHRKMY